MTNISAVYTQGMMRLTAVVVPSFLALVLALPFQAQAAFLTQQLDLGMTNADVTSLQTFLAADSTIYPEGIVSGYFGPLTAAAVSRFQTANGLSSVGRVGPLTLATINAQMGGGGAGTGGGSDVSAPIIYPETVSVTPNSATISWTVNEAAKSRVTFGTTRPFLYSTAPSVSTSGFGSTASITLTGLQSHGTYYYVLESVDGAGNIAWTVSKPLTTQ